MQPWPYPRWVAHRGAGKLAPENTLAAFRLGAQYGYRIFECDAKLSADGVPFLMHDTTLDRTTNARKLFDAGASMTGSDHSWSELASLDAGGWHSRTYAGEPLPTLANISRFCIANGHFINVEIKPTPGAELKTGEVVARQLADQWKNAPTPPLLTSFRPESLEGALASAKQLPRGLLLDTLWQGWMEKAVALDCVAIVCNYALWDDATVARVKGAGMRCLSYTVNDQWAAQRLIALGTDGLITDRVDLFSPV